jgi:hypothetical protein
MLKSICCLMILPTCLLVGCGGSPAELPVAKSAHGGHLVTLPGGKGYAEIIVEAATAGGGRKAQVKPRIVAYFFQPDGTSELSPGPTEVKVKLGTGEKSPVVDLSPEPTAKPSRPRLSYDDRFCSGACKRPSPPPSSRLGVSVLSLH